jgi:uncharacterized membrane protein YjjP (DUF1212 family)
MMDNTEHQVAKNKKSRGEAFEGIAFTFCKAALLVLIFGKFSLAVISALAAGFYILAYVNRKRDTRCFLQYPLFIAGLWMFVCGLAVYSLVTGAIRVPWLM